MGMLNLYVDKENIESLVKSGDQYSLYECASLVRKGLNIHYNFSKSELKHNKRIDLWFRCTKGEGVQNEISFAENEGGIFPQHPIEGTGALDKNRSGIFLLNKKAQCESVIKKNFVLIETVGQELNLLRRLDDLGEGHEEFLTSIASWEDYCAESCPDFPLNEFVLVDPYYFSKKEIYDEDDNELIRALVRPINQYPVCITIITNSKYLDTDNIILNDEIINIRDLLIQETGSRDCKVTIVAHPKVHDRRTITNYFSIYSGCGFHSNDPTIKDDVTVDVKSFAKRSYFNKAQELLLKYQKKITSIKERKNQGFILGDRCSHFLHF